MFWHAQSASCIGKMWLIRKYFLLIKVMVKLIKIYLLLWSVLGLTTSYPVVFGILEPVGPGHATVFQ